MKKISSKPIESRALIIGACYVIMIVFITVFIAGFTNAEIFGVFQATGAETSGTADYSFWIIGPDIVIVYAWIFLPCFLVAVTKRFKLNKRELAIICTMALTSFLIPTYFSGIYSALSWFPGGYLIGEPYTRLLLRDGNPLLAPTSPITYFGFWYGSNVVPWRAWIIPLAFWIFYFMSQQLFALFLATALLRRTYVEIESLPFPMATGMVKTIDLATSKGSRSQMLRNKWLWLGMAIGFVGTLPYWLHFVVPSFSVSPPWADLTPHALLPWVPLVLFLDPFLIGGAFFMPVEVLFSTVLFFIILYVVVPTVATTLGIFGPFSPGQKWMSVFRTMNWGTAGSAGWINWGQYSYGYQSIWFGALLGFVIWPMFRMRKSIWESIKAIWSKTALEDGEPLPYRYSWLLAAFFFILHVFLISFAIGMGAYPLWWSSAFMILMTVVWVLGFSRVRGYAYPPFFSAQTTDYLKVVYYEWSIFGDNSPITPLIRGNATALQSTWIMFFGAGPIYMSNIANVAPRILESYKIGKSTKTDSRNILIGAVIAIVLAVVLTPILYLLFSYHFGILEKYSMSGALSYTGNWIAAGAAAIGGMGKEFPLNWWLWWPGPPKWTVHVYEVIGFIAVVVIYMLRMKVVKLRMLHPVGLIMAIAAGPIVFFPWLVAFIAKWLTIKIGGVKLYEEKGMPFALGLIVAFCLMVLLSGLFWSISNAI